MPPEKQTPIGALVRKTREPGRDLIGERADVAAADRVRGPRAGVAAAGVKNRVQEASGSGQPMSSISTT